MLYKFTSQIGRIYTNQQQSCIICFESHVWHNPKSTAHYRVLPLRLSKRMLLVAAKGWCLVAVIHVRARRAEKYREITEIGETGKIENFPTSFLTA